MRTTFKAKNALLVIYRILLLSILLSACKPAEYNNLMGWVYLDVNENDVRDEGDTPVPGVKVSLFGSQDDIALQETVTDENGEYTFVLSGINVGNNGYVQFTNPDKHVFAHVDAGTDDVDSDSNSSGIASFVHGRRKNKELIIDALIQKAPVSQTSEKTPTPTTAPTTTPTATPIPRSGFSDPKGDAVSVITGQLIPKGYPALDIREVDWKIEDDQVFIDVAIDIPVNNKPELFEWGVQAGVVTAGQLIVADYAILPEGAFNQQYNTITGTLTSIPTATLVSWTSSQSDVYTATFTFNTGVIAGEEVSLFVRGFSRVSGLVGVIDTGLWPGHPALDTPDVLPLVLVNTEYIGGSPRLSVEDWDKIRDRVNKRYGTSLDSMNHIPGWQADRNTSFSDPANDVYDADSFALLGESDPAVDILFVDVNTGITDTLSVDIFMATSPMSTTLSDYSFYSEVAVRDDTGQEHVVAYEIHAGEKRQGLLDLSTFQLVPGTDSYVSILPDRINMLVPGKLESGEIFVSNFHMKTENSIRTYDESVINSFRFTPQYDIDTAIALIESSADVVVDAESTVTPTPTSTQIPTPTASPQTTSTPEPTLTPTIITVAPDDGDFGSIITSTFVVTDTGDITPVDVALLFLDGYETAHNENNDEWLLSSLHPDSINRYGLSQCRAYLEQVTGCCENFTAGISEYPVEFVYDKDDIVTSYSGAVRLQVEFTVKGETQPRESPMHILVGQINEFWYANWFTDCGTPEQ